MFFVAMICLKLSTQINMPMNKHFQLPERGIPNNNFHFKNINAEITQSIVGRKITLQLKKMMKPY